MKKNINKDTLAQELNDAQTKLMQEYHLKQHGINLPAKPSTDGYYHLYVEDKSKKSGRKQLKAKTLDKLIEKVDDYLKDIDPNVTRTFKETYELILQKKLERVKDPDLKKSKETTIHIYRCEYKRFFEGTTFEQMDVSKINKHDVEDIVDYNLQRYDLRPKALKSLQGILSAVFKYAYQRYWISENLYDRIDFKEFQDGCITPTSIKNRCYSEEEILKLIEFAQERQRIDPKKSSAYAYEFQIYTGLRRGELTPIRWNDLIYDKSGIVYLNINKRMADDNTVVNRTKTNKDRLIPLTEKAKELIDRLVFQHKKFYPDSKYLFPTNERNGMLSYYSVYSFHETACRNLNIPISRDFIKGTHAFRRSVATDLRNKGINPQAVSNYLGHNRMTEDLNYYVGGFDTNVAQQIANIS